MFRYFLQFHWHMLLVLAVTLFCKIPACFGLIIPPVNYCIWHDNQERNLKLDLFVVLSMPQKTLGFGAKPQLSKQGEALTKYFKSAIVKKMTYFKVVKVR